MFKNQFPCVPLDQWPTPIQKLERFGDYIGLDNLYMKRDDVSLLGLGGNKIRKLEFWLGEALARGCDTILVAGGEQSNLVRLTAAACVKAGVDCIAIHNCNPPQSLQGNALLNNLFNAKSVYLGTISEQEREIQTSLIYNQLIAEGKKPYIVNDEFVGTLGYAECAEEIYQQNIEQGLGIKNVVIVGAMAFTSSGFIYGNSLLAEPFMTHVVSVEYPKDKLDRLIADKTQQLAQLTGVKPKHNYKDFTYTDDDYMGEGWGIPTKSSMEQIYNLAKTEAIIIDHVYNAKTIDGLVGLVKKGIIKTNEPTCIIHTGGAPSVFAYTELIQTYLKNR